MLHIPTAAEVKMQLFYMWDGELFFFLNKRRKQNNIIYRLYLYTYSRILEKGGLTLTAVLR